MNETLLTRLDGRATVTLKEIAERLGYPISTVRRWAAEQKIPGAFRPIGKWSRWRFRRDIIEDWYAKLPNIDHQGMDPQHAVAASLARTKSKRKAVK